jgi:MFS family permease
VFLPSLQAEFGWTRAQILTAALVMNLGILPAWMAAGWIADRYGVRRLVMISQVLLGLCFAALGVGVNALSGFYVIFFLIGVLGAGTLPITFARAISGWFDQRRGLALGLALVGTGICGLIIPLLVTLIIERLGWKSGYLAIGALPILIGVPVSFRFLKDPPGTKALPLPAALSPSGLTLLQAVRGSRFWLLGFVFLLISAAVTGVISNLVPLLRDQGYPATLAAELAGVIGITVVIGRLGVGLLVDRFWAPLVGLAVLTPPVVALGLLMGPGLGMLPTALAIAVIGLAVGAEVDLNAYLTSRYFGLRAFGQIFAAQYLFVGIGSALGAPAIGWLRDRTGLYDTALKFAASAFLLGAVGLLALGSYPVWGGNGVTADPAAEEPS